MDEEISLLTSIAEDRQEMYERTEAAHGKGAATADEVLKTRIAWREAQVEIVRAKKRAGK